MKRIFTIIALSLVMSGLAIAGGNVTYQTILASSNSAPTTAPTSSGPGVPLVVQGAQVSKCSVTIADYSDGGSADYEYIKTGGATAYVYKVTTKYPDAGSGWMRAPDLDVTVDAGTTSVHGITVPVPTAIGNIVAAGGEYLYYSTNSVTGQDAGTPVHNVLIQCRY